MASFFMHLNQFLTEKMQSDRKFRRHVIDPSCKVWTVACFVVEARIDVSHITSGRLCLAIHKIWPILDLSMSVSQSFNGASRCTALAGSTTMV